MKPMDEDCVQTSAVVLKFSRSYFQSQVRRAAFLNYLKHSSSDHLFNQNRLFIVLLFRKIYLCRIGILQES